MHQHVAIISSPIVSSSNEHVNPVFPSTWEEAFLTTTTTLHSSHEKDRLRIGSWNANSLNPHIYEAQALGMDILAIQEARISQDVVPGIRASLGKNGYRLFHGTLPNFKLQGHNRKAMHIDQTVPGVAFIVKEHIPVQEVFFEDLQHWESRGRFSALKVFLSIKNGFYCSMPTRLHKIALLFSMTSLIFLLSMRTRIAFSSLTSMLVLGKVTLFRRFPQLVGSPLPSTLLLVSLPSNILPAVHPASTLLWLLNSSRKKFRLSSKDLF